MIRDLRGRRHDHPSDDARDGRGGASWPTGSRCSRTGAIIAEGPPATLGGRADAPATIAFALPGGAAALPPALAARAHIGSGGRVAITSYHALGDLTELALYAAETGTQPIGLEVRRPTLEDTYLALTENGAHR